MKISELNPNQLTAAKAIIKAFRDTWADNGVKCSNILIAGALGLGYEETGLEIKPETSYRNTPASRIRQVFGLMFKGWKDLDIDKLKVDDVEFFSKVYQGINGNMPGTHDGYIYRGAGFNQITGRGLFQLAGGVTADDLKTIDGAAKAFAVFQWNTIRQGQQSGKFRLWMGCNSTSQLLYPEQGAYVTFAANTGWSVRPEKYATGRFPICEQAAKEFYIWIQTL